MFLPYFIPINVYFAFFTLVWRKLLFLVWRFYSIKGHLYNNKRRNVPYNHTIDSFAQKSVSFSQRFPTTVPPLSVFFCKRSFFRAKNLRRSYSSFTKASAFRTKRSFFRTKSRLSFCSSLPFETRRIYNHFLQTKFLSHKKIIETVWLSLHPSLPFFTVKEDFFAQNSLPISQPSPPLSYDPKHSKNRFFRAKKQQASQKEVFFCSKWRFFQAKISKESIFPHEKNCFLGWKNLLYPTKETALSHEKNCFSTYINKRKK